MVRRWAVIGVMTAALMAVAPSSAAGGSFFSGIVWKRVYHPVGLEVVGHVELLYKTVELAEEAFEGGHVYAYLDPGYGRFEPYDRPPRRVRPARISEEAVAVGRVDLTEQDANLVYGRVFFEVPRVASGHYRVVLCDATCSTLAANAWPTPIRITESALEARLLRRIDRLKARTGHRMRAEARTLRREIREVDQNKASRAFSYLVASRVRDLSERVEELSAVPSRGDGWGTRATWFLTGAVLVGAGAASARSRRRKQWLVAPDVQAARRQGGLR